MRADGRFGRFSLRLLQERPPSRERKTPADPATTISSSLAGETARSRRLSPTIDSPWNAVRFSQFLPLLSERYTNWPKAYTRGLAPAGLRTCAPFSGRLIDLPSGTGGTAVSAGAAVHRSKSLVSKVLPRGCADRKLIARRRVPYAVHRSCGRARPVPGPWPRCPHVSSPELARQPKPPARARPEGAPEWRPVWLCYSWNESIVPLTYRQKRPETADFSSPQDHKNPFGAALASALLMVD